MRPSIQSIYFLILQVPHTYLSIKTSVIITIVLDLKLNMSKESDKSIDSEACVQFTCITDFLEPFFEAHVMGGIILGSPLVILNVTNHIQHELNLLNAKVAYTLVIYHKNEKYNRKL